MRGTASRATSSSTPRPSSERSSRALASARKRARRSAASASARAACSRTSCRDRSSARLRSVTSRSATSRAGAPSHSVRATRSSATTVPPPSRASSISPLSPAGIATPNVLPSISKAGRPNSAAAAGFAKRTTPSPSKIIIPSAAWSMMVRSCCSSLVIAPDSEPRGGTAEQCGSAERSGSRIGECEKSERKRVRGARSKPPAAAQPRPRGRRSQRWRCRVSSSMPRTRWLPSSARNTTALHPRMATGRRRCLPSGSDWPEMARISTRS